MTKLTLEEIDDLEAKDPNKLTDDECHILKSLHLSEVKEDKTTSSKPFDEFDKLEHISFEISTNEKITVCESKDFMNDVICNLSLNQIKLILLLGAQVKEEDTKIKTYSISISDLCDLYGIQKYRPGRTEKLLKELKNLTGQLLEFYDYKLDDDGDECTAVVGWIDMFIINHTRQVVYFKLSGWLYEYFYCIPKEHRLIYKLQYIFNLKKKSTVNLYRWAYSKKGFKSYFTSVKIEDIKQVICGNPEMRTSNFIQTHLTPAIEEINQKTDMYIHVKPIKKKGSSSFTSLKFHILQGEKRDEYLDSMRNLKKELNEEYNEMLDRNH